MDVSPNSQRNLKLQLWIAVASTVLLIAKFIGYFLTHSVAVLTDAMESIVNVAAAFLGLYSIYVAGKPRDQDHPYGHGKAEYLSAAVEGTLVFSAGALIIYKSVKSFFEPYQVVNLNTGIYLLAATAIINWLLGTLAYRQGNKTNSLALAASGKHLQTDSYSTFGIIVGLIMITLTGEEWLDAVVAIVFAVFILFTGYRIVRRSIAGIMDEADIRLLTRMIGVLNVNRKDNWVDLHNLRVIRYGDVLHVDCHLTVPWYLNVHEAHMEVEALGGLIREHFGEAMELFAHSDGCMYFQCHICDKLNCPVRQHAFKKEILWTVDNVLQNKKHGLEDINTDHENNNNLENRTGI
jgi:cation diffusion facilitator family transporter